MSGEPTKKAGLDWRNFVADDDSTPEERGVRPIAAGALKIDPGAAAAQDGSASSAMECDDSAHSLTGAAVEELLAPLSPRSYESVTMHKGRGNDAFKRGDWQHAIESYTSALNHFGLRVGSAEQRSHKVTLLSNQAEALLKMDEFLRARDACDAALQLDPTHGKSLYRRARALRQLGPWMGGVAAMDAAAADLRKLLGLGGGGAEAAALLKEVEQVQEMMAPLFETVEGRQVAEMLDGARFGHGIGKDLDAEMASQ